MKVKYCDNCGTKLKKIKKPANKIDVWMYSFGGSVDSFPLGDQFCEETGKRQYGIELKCPNKKWYNNCYYDVDEDQKLTTTP